MKWVIWGTAALLAVLHNDFWYWGDRSLLLGFLPIGLAFHAGFSIVAAILWFVAIHAVWPSKIEEWADETPAKGEDPA